MKVSEDGDELTGLVEFHDWSTPSSDKDSTIVEMSVTRSWQGNVIDYGIYLKRNSKQRNTLSIEMGEENMRDLYEFLKSHFEETENVGT